EDRVLPLVGDHNELVFGIDGYAAGLFQDAIRTPDAPARRDVAVVALAPDANVILAGVAAQVVACNSGHDLFLRGIVNDQPIARQSSLRAGDHRARFHVALVGTVKDRNLTFFS